MIKFRLLIGLVFFLCYNYLDAQCADPVFQKAGGNPCIELTFSSTPSPDPPTIIGYNYVSGSGGGAYRYFPDGGSASNCGGGGYNTGYTGNLVINGTTCTYASGNLPVTLISFEGKNMDGGSYMLHWQTASEIDNDYFSIERSSNGYDFDQIGKIQGAGTTNEIQAYSFEDKRPTRGVNYYRLVQYDFDGRNEASDIIVFENVDMTETTMILQKEIIKIFTADKVLNLEVFSIDGRLVKRFDEKDQGIYQVQEIESGYYIARLTTDRQVKSQKIYIK